MNLPTFSKLNLKYTKHIFPVGQARCSFHLPPSYNLQILLARGNGASTNVEPCNDHKDPEKDDDDDDDDAGDDDEVEEEDVEEEVDNDDDEEEEWNAGDEQEDEDVAEREKDLSVLPDSGSTT